MSLNTDHLSRCIETLHQSLVLLNQYASDSLEYEIYRNATIKGYELSLETAGKLLRKALKPWFATPREVDELVFKDVFRYGAKHGLLTVDEAKRWFEYRDNRNNTAHDYGVGFAEDTLKLLPQFIKDARRLKDSLDHVKT